MENPWWKYLDQSYDHWRHKYGRQTNTNYITTTITRSWTLIETIIINKLNWWWWWWRVRSIHTENYSPCSQGLKAWRKRGGGCHEHTAMRFDSRRNDDVILQKKVICQRIVRNTGNKRNLIIVFNIYVQLVIIANSCDAISLAILHDCEWQWLNVRYQPRDDYDYVNNLI